MSHCACLGTLGCVKLRSAQRLCSEHTTLLPLCVFEHTEHLFHYVCFVLLCVLCAGQEQRVSVEERTLHLLTAYCCK
jgi:hypothetical protein